MPALDAEQRSNNMPALLMMSKGLGAGHA